MEYTKLTKLHLYSQQQNDFSIGKAYYHRGARIKKHDISYHVYIAGTENGCFPILRMKHVAVLCLSIIILSYVFSPVNTG